MKRQTLAFATALLALPLFAYAQNGSAPDSQNMQGSQNPMSAHQEAAMMKPARATLEKTLDARKDHPGEAVDAKLNQTVKFTNGTELPSGTILVGKVAQDDMQQQGMSKLALRFDQAKLKNGTMVPLRATIVGFYGPGQPYADGGVDQNQVPNDWTAKTLQLDQMDVTKDVDLHSRISSQNSGVFVSTKKDDVKLREGSEIQFAIAPASTHAANVAGQ